MATAPDAAGRLEGLQARGEVFPEQRGRAQKSQREPAQRRKVYAVGEYRRTGDLDAVRRKLNHDPAHVATTLVYALSDQLTPEELKSMAPAKRRGRKE